jgi:hypothetical protein
MKHFEHLQVKDWRDLQVGETLHASKHNSPGKFAAKITEIGPCSSPCTKCYSNNTGFIVGDTHHCIFNHAGQSFWEEVDDINVVGKRED